MTMEPHYLLNGEPVNIAEFLHANDEDFTRDDVRAILALKPGSKLSFGGGAATLFVVERKR